MNCLIGQSGGPTSVINSSLAGAIQAAIDNNFDKIFLSLHGIEGFLNGKVAEVDKEKFQEVDGANRLKNRPSSILGSCRFKLDEDIESPVYKEIFEKFAEYEISSFVYIGGNDSMDTVMKLNKYMKVNDIKDVNIVGSPKTIDNDLMGMDHSPGFGSACKYLVNTLRDIRCDVDIYDKKTVTFVEIMGRNAGWLAASTLLANYGMDKEVVNLVYLSEKAVLKEEIINDIREAHKYEDNLIIAVSEGFMDANLNFKDEIYRSYDRGFNHPVISGISRKLSEFVYQMMDIKTKAVELNIVQRVNHHISKRDSDEAFSLGYKSLELSMSESDLVPVLIRNSKSIPYSTIMQTVESSEIANKEKTIPTEWFESKERLTEEVIKYALPLIEGESDQNYVNGIIEYIKLEEFIK